MKGNLHFWRKRTQGFSCREINSFDWYLDRLLCINIYRQDKFYHIRDKLHPPTTHQFDLTTQSVFYLRLLDKLGIGRLDGIKRSLRSIDCNLGRIKDGVTDVVLLTGRHPTLQSHWHFLRLSLGIIIVNGIRFYCRYSSRAGQLSHNGLVVVVAQQWNMMTAILMFGKIDIDGIETFGKLIVEQCVALIAYSDKQIFRKIWSYDNVLWNVLQFQGYLDLYLIFTVKRLLQPEQGSNH